MFWCRCSPCASLYEGWHKNWAMLGGQPCITGSGIEQRGCHRSAVNAKKWHLLPCYSMPSEWGKGSQPTNCEECLGVELLLPKQCAQQDVFR